MPDWLVAICIVIVGAILKGLNVTDIERRHELANGNLCLAKEGELYIVYMPEEGELKLSGLKKDLRYRWYNPKSGKLKEEATIKDIEMDFRAPFYPAVLIVDRQ